MSMRDFRYYVVPDEDIYRLTIPKFNRIVGSETWHDEVADYVLAGSRDWMLSRLDALAVPGIQIDLGFPSNFDIRNRGRLPVFANLIADRIKEIAGTQLVSIKLSKRHSTQTTLSIAEVIPTRPARAIAAATVSTRRSYATPGFASEVRDAVGEIRAAINPKDPLCLNLSYVTGLPRTWSRLWLPTISGIFSTESARDLFRDTQVMELALDHHSVGERLGHSVNIAVSLHQPSLTA